MLSYMDTLKEMSASSNVSLKKAFVHAGVRDSTYYRAKQGRDLRHSTALLVEASIGKLSALQERRASSR